MRVFLLVASRNTKGRADLYLFVDDKGSDNALTYTSSKQWEDATVFWTGKLKPGHHHIWYVSSPYAICSLYQHFPAE